MKDPRAKIVVIICLSLGTLASDSVLFAGGAALVYAGWSWAAAIPVRDLAGKLKRVAIFLAAVMAAHAMTGTGTVVADLGAVYVTQEGITQGAGHCCRLIVVLWGAVLLAHTTTLEELANAVEGRGAATMRPLVGVVTVALAYLPILVESGRRIKARNQWRSGDRGFLAGIRLVADSALPMVVAAIRDADRLAEAMEARSYDPLSARTPFDRTPSSRGELSLAAAAAMAALVAVAGYV